MADKTPFPSEISLNVSPDNEAASAESDTAAEELSPRRHRRLLKAISSKFSGVRRLRVFGARHRGRLIVAGAMSLFLGIFSSGFLTGWAVEGRGCGSQFRAKTDCR